MVSPQVPGGAAKRQTIFNYQPHGKRYYPMGIATAHRGKITHVSVKVYLIHFTAMFGINKLDIMRSARSGISQIMQESPPFAIPVASFATDGASPPSIVPGAVPQNRLWQIFRFDNFRYSIFIFLHVVALLCVFITQSIMPPLSLKCKRNPD